RQITPSTPGVLLPVLLVTRFTARHLAENEQVRRRCKARALPRFPSLSALAIRIWSRKTCLLIFGQLRVGQISFCIAEDAPVNFCCCHLRFFINLILHILLPFDTCPKWA